MSVEIGTVLNGYCNGYFGRDSYGEKRVEGSGVDWVVVREDDGEPNCAFFNSKEDRDYYIDLWQNEENDGAF
jgi:hypothetical protein